MKLTIDLESRSEINLKDAGLGPYSESPSTDILCIAFKEDDNEPVIFVPSKFAHLYPVHLYPQADSIGVGQWIEGADTIEAHNAGFEQAMWHQIMHKRYKFPDLPIEKLRCSAALAASYALPRALNYATQALGTEEKKDNLGYRIMMKMCKPRRPTKKDPSIWHEDPDDFKLLCDYCKQDVNAEYSLSQLLYDLPKKEQELWELDQKINRRGIKIDLEAVNNLLYKIEHKSDALRLEVQLLTQGQVNSTTQAAATREWLLSKGLDIPDMQKETVINFLKKDDLSANCRRILEIRQSLSKSSTAKLKKMIEMACKDGRVRYTFLFDGANTGRWSGKGIQTHNLPRDSFDEETINEVLSMGVSQVDKKHNCVIKAASKCIRGMIIAEEGKLLYAQDFSSVEARVLAWIAGDERTLKSFREGLDLYKVTAAEIYNKNYSDITKEERAIGKVAVLALGYQGWVGAFQSMAPTYGVYVPEDKAAEIAGKWRAAHPRIVQFWKGVEIAAIKAITTKNAFSYGRIKFGIRGDFMHCRLPSGRLLSWYTPFTKTVVDKYGTTKQDIRYMGVSSTSGKWSRLNTYGGKLTENVVQAIARDLLAEAMVRLDKAGFDIVMHVHDEIVCEGKNKSLEEFSRIMSEVPIWAKGLPIACEGWEGKRYKKG